MSINPGAIGISLPFERVLDLAIKYGFEAISPQIGDLQGYSEKKRADVIAKMKRRGIGWDSTNLPVQFRNSETEFRKGMDPLIANARVLQQVGATRMNTWIMPTHGTRTYRENFRLHTNRLREVAQVIQPFGIRLGLEYVGPKALMSKEKFSFIRTMKELQELLQEINMPNVGIQLDAFHWFCAGETVENIERLNPTDIVTVDLNDAKAGRTADEQLDWERELPGDSGVIDLQGFLSALKKIGYDGPVRAEPFNKTLNEMGDEAAMVATFKAMKRSFVNAE
ncbi:MAG: sugar phosphate isomerase/epimerase [Roseivirga sp.]|nr:sugar phosphate isomerase/epimerase [Roseivirga sp.]